MGVPISGLPAATNLGEADEFEIEQGGVKVDGEVVKDITATVKAPSVIQKGKRHFVKLIKG